MGQLTLALFFVLHAVPSWAVEYFVATTGSDSNSCTAARNGNSPKLTIPAGISCLSSGDTLTVKAGTYTGQQIFNPPPGTASAYTVIQGDPSGARPLLLPNGGSPSFQRGFYCDQGEGCRYIEFRHFEVSGAYEGGKLPGNTTFGFAHHIRVIDNVIHDTVGNGWHCITSSSGFLGGDHLFQGNEWYNIGKLTPNYGPGWNVIYNPGNRTIVERNTFRNSINGVGIWRANMPLQGIIVRQNLFYDMGRRSIDPWQVDGGSAVHVSSPGGGHRIYRNVIYRSGESTVFDAIRTNTQFDTTNLTDVQVFNNTIYNTLHASADGIRATANMKTPGGMIVRNNVVINAGAGIVDNSGVGALVQSFNTTSGTASALWTNPASYDLTVLAGSPLIDAGTDTGFIGFNGAAPDRGAFESVGAPSATITTNVMTVMFPMNANVPISGVSVSGWSVSCTANPTACPTTPVVGTAQKRVGTDTQVDLGISGITSNACASGQDWRVSYASVTGTLSDFVNIGAFPGLHQPIHSFSNVLSANACTGSGPPAPTVATITYNMDEGTGTQVTDIGGGALHATLVGGAGWGPGKTGTGVVTSGATQQMLIPYGLGIDPSSQSMTWVVPIYIPEGQTGLGNFFFGTETGVDQRAYLGMWQGTFRVARQTLNVATAGTSNLVVDVGWNHLCARWDATTDTVTLYKNGTQGAGGATGSYTSFTFPTNFEAPIIGAGFSTPAVTNTYDNVQIFTSLQDCAALYASWNPPVVPTGDVFSQTAVQFEDVYRPSAGGGPTVLSSPGNAKKVVKDGAVAIVVQIECDDCDQTAFRIEARDNGTGDWLQIPNTPTASNLYMWGTGGQQFLNNFLITYRVLENGCSAIAGGTILTAAQIPQVTLPANGCVMLRYLIRVSPTASGYTEIRAAKQGGVAFTGTIVPGRIDITEPQGGGVGF